MCAKLFVLDTNVMLSDPEALFSFAEHSIVLPITVLEELDEFKTSKNELGYNAREVSRRLDILIGDKNPAMGVPLGEGLGLLYISSGNVEYSYTALKDSADNYIIGTAQMASYFIGAPVAEVILVSKDINCRLKAKSVGVKAQDYLKQKSDATDVGLTKTITCLYDSVFNDLANGVKIPAEGNCFEDIKLEENDNLICMSPDRSKSILGRYCDKGIGRVGKGVKACGIKPHSAEQTFFMDALMDSKLDLVICNGVAGTGKTLLSLACGIESVDRGLYHSLLVMKAIMPVGKDIGYLKGDKEEKITEWLMPYFDNLDAIAQYKGKRVIDRMFEEGLIEIDALTYVRGRSLMSKFVIIDEVQNLTAAQVKTIVTRIADGSKLVLLGDTQQIDNPYLDASDCGLTYAMSRMTGLSNVAIMQLVRSERGRLASQAVARL